MGQMLLAAILSSCLSSGKFLCFLFFYFINHTTPLPECSCDLGNSILFSACTYDSRSLVTIPWNSATPI